MNIKISILCVAMAFAVGCSSNCSIDGYKTVNTENSQITSNSLNFSGYTHHWFSIFRQQYRYGNLYKDNVGNVQKYIIQNKLDLAEELGLTGLQMQEGFMNGLLNSNDTLTLVDKNSELGKKLSAKAPVMQNYGSYQQNLKNYDAIHAFILKKGCKTVYAVVGDPDRTAKLKSMIDTARKVIGEYDMKRGWFGIETHTQSVTCSMSNQLEAISRGMNEGNSWFLFSGLYEYISQATTPEILAQAGCPAVLDFGSSPLYGSDFSELQVQLMFDHSHWENYKKEHGGYISGGMPSTVGDNDKCDFYFAEPGIAKHINAGTKPFVVGTGDILGGTRNCMVLFNDKDDEFNKEKIWEDIMSRKAVAVCGDCIMGDDKYRQTIQLLILDRIFLEEYYGDRVNMEVSVINDNVHIMATNFYDHKISCKFSVNVPEQVSVCGKSEQIVTLRAGETRDIVFELTPAAAAMGRRNAVTIKAEWNGIAKTTIADYEMPPAVSTHKLLYGAPSCCKFPVSIHNIGNTENVDVKVSVADDKGEVFCDNKTVKVQKGEYTTTEFDLTLPQGNYTVTTSAMGVDATTQLGIGSGQGNVSLHEEDLNNDGMNEYIMENDKVRVTLIRHGARAIELYVKDRDDNVFFKLWPENPIDEHRSYRERGYWPYGGFEDFLGQASAETHKVFDAEIVKDGGDYAQVVMTGDLYGNIIQKTYTLYADSPMLEARFAMDFINPEMNVLGPQPILALGEKHWTEDKFYVPTAEGLICKEMMPDRYYGSMFYPTEGWHSGYDTKEDISFVGAFPVDRPMYLHMWMNHPNNGDTHYFYSEFQPWITIEQGVTSYFSYYMWAEGGKWEDSLQQMKDRNLITKK